MHGKRNAKANREDALRELLAGKIAEIEVGGDENLEAPIDLSGEGGNSNSRGNCRN